MNSHRGLGEGRLSQAGHRGVSVLSSNPRVVQWIHILFTNKKEGKRLTKAEGYDNIPEVSKGKVSGIRKGIGTGGKKGHREIFGL